MTKQQFYNTFASLDNDVLRWKFLITNARILNKSKDIILYLDNDDTWVSFEENTSTRLRSDSVFFDNHIGWDDGIFDLLKAVGIKVKYV